MMTLCGLLIHCLHESVALSMPLYINLRMTSTPYFMSFFLAWHKELSNPGCCSFQFVDSLNASPLFLVPYILVRTESEWAESLAFSSMHLCMKFPYTQPVPHHLEPSSRECRFFLINTFSSGLAASPLRVRVLPHLRLCCGHCRVPVRDTIE
ncbi:hypothetical protein EDD85DRAFT_382629 [Armillaria nabsnona]|nr:hypothetical protein EDD85DRAFT_382629 [Armillaria nabsnona]